MIRCDKCGSYYATETCQPCDFAELTEIVNSWEGLDVRPSENANLGVQDDDY